MEWEQPILPPALPRIILPEWSCVELKFLDADEFDHWSATDFDASERTQRKRREWEVFRALADGGEPPGDVVPVEAPDGVHVIDYVRSTWCGRERCGPAIAPSASCASWRGSDLSRLLIVNRAPAADGGELGGRQPRRDRVRLRTLPPPVMEVDRAAVLLPRRPHEGVAGEVSQRGPARTVALIAELLHPPAEHRLAELQLPRLEAPAPAADPGGGRRAAPRAPVPALVRHTSATSFSGSAMPGSYSSPSAAHRP